MSTLFFFSLLVQEDFFKVLRGHIVLATHLLPLTSPGLRPTIQNCSQGKMGTELLDAIHLPGCPLGALAALQTFLLTAPNSSYSTSTSVYSTMFYEHFLFCFFSFLVQEDFFKVLRGHIN